MPFGTRPRGRDEGGKQRIVIIGFNLQMRLRFGERNRLHRWRGDEFKHMWP